MRRERERAAGHRAQDADAGQRAHQTCQRDGMGADLGSQIGCRARCVDKSVRQPQARGHVQHLRQTESHQLLAQRMGVIVGYGTDACVHA